MKTIILIFFLIFSIKVNSQVWEPLSPLLYGWGEPAQIYVLKVYNNKLLVAGAIRKIGNYVLPQPQFGAWSRPLTWDGYIYDSIPGLYNFSDVVDCFAEFNNKLYCSGYFQNVNNLPNTKYIARFNGTNMEALANSTPNDKPWVLKAKDYLYLAGHFSLIGSTPYGYVARYNGTNYSSLGVGVQSTNPTVYAMTEYNNEIIISGGFDWVGNIYVPNGIAAWNGMA